MRKLKFVPAWIPLLSFLFLAVTATAGPLEDIEKAIGSGDHQAAYRIAKPLAEKGMPKAQNLLGFLYHTGQGVKQDYGEAVKWYRKAADQGDAEGQNNVGVMYEHGTGVWQNYGEAAKWYWKSAEQGNPIALNNLGVLYAFGKGVKQDYVFAYMLFDLAASHYSDSQREGREQAVYNRNLAARVMTPAQLEHAQKLAHEMKGKKGI